MFRCFDPTLTTSKQTYNQTKQCNMFSWQSLCPLRCHVTVGNLQRRLRQCPGSIQRCLGTAELCGYLIGFYRGVRVVSKKVRKFMPSNKTRLNRKQANWTKIRWWHVTSACKGRILVIKTTTSFWNISVKFQKRQKSPIHDMVCYCRCDLRFSTYHVWCDFCYVPWIVSCWSTQPF